MINDLTPFLDQPFWRYLRFAKQFRSRVILRMFHDNMANDLIFQKFDLPFVHYHLNSVLEIFATVQLNGLKSPHDIQISCLDYTIYEIVIAWDLTDSRQQVWNLVDAARQT